MDRNKYLTSPLVVSEQAVRSLEQLVSLLATAGPAVLGTGSPGSPFPRARVAHASGWQEMRCPAWTGRLSGD